MKLFKNMKEMLVKDPNRVATELVETWLRRGWDTKDEDDALCILVEMPGLGKEDVKVYVEQNILVIKGESHKVSEEDDTSRFKITRYSSSLHLNPSIHKCDSIKAETKNGVLKVVEGRGEYGCVPC